ncbi:MAG: phosphoesterase [Acidobacteriota bacterium]|nr:phosphoesterase [Acidobacteriota bacterium]
MRNLFWAILLFTCPLIAQTRQINLPNSKVLSVPSPGHLDSVNGFPVTIALSPDHDYAALLNDGYGAEANQSHQSIAIVNLKTRQLTDFPEERLPEESRQSYFIGLAFSPDGHHLYASVGSISDPTAEKPSNTGNGIAVYSFREGAVAPERFIKIAPQKLLVGKKVAYGIRKTAGETVLPYPAGLVVIAGSDGDRLLIANNLSDNVVLLNARDGHVLQSFDLSTHESVPASFPYTVAASRDGKRAWCSLWNLSRVAELDLGTGKVSRWTSLLEPSDPLSPGSHPTAMLLNHDESILYVALANADRVAAISTVTGQVISFLDTNTTGQKFSGSYPNALAESSDGKRLFVADAGINAIAVFDVSNLGAAKSASDQLKVNLTAQGFIPTDWYPSAVAFAGNDLLIATAKGQGTGPNNGAPASEGSGHRHRKHPYIATLLYGSISIVNFAKLEKDLPELTRKVETANLFNADPGNMQFAGGSNPIRHVIYIIKENRTYDQILGDLKVGNGDSSLTLYGDDITPNLHKLALQFGVLDNFYDSGEVSGDGHDWSTAATTTDYNEKTWQISYRGRERTYDYQGTVADESPLELGFSDIDAPSTGYIWDNLASHNLTYRDYGEYVQAIWCKRESKSGKTPSPKEGTPSPDVAKCERPVVQKGEALPENVGNPKGSPSPWPWAIPLPSKIVATKSVLRDHYDPLFPDFGTEYPDQLRADEFLREFDGFVSARRDGTGTQLPSFVLLYLPNDHTNGTSPGKPRPAASVADNDLAVGRVVDAISHSVYWDDTAIFILEDDAQDGADHVDAHRSIAFEISKFSPATPAHTFVDSRFYTTVNMMHTMETLLGLLPMNQNDAYAPVMFPLFTGAGTQPPFTADWSNRDNGLIYKTNPPRGKTAEESAKMDFTRPDANNAAVLNKILWRDRKGRVQMPAPKHTVLPTESLEDKD